MRAIACLLLGLLALTGMRPACATLADAGHMSTMSASEQVRPACDRTHTQDAHHRCGAPSCLGCALPFTRTACPAPSIAPRLVRLAITPAAPMAGLGPLAAIPPPRPLA